MRDNKLGSSALSLLKKLFTHKNHTITQAKSAFTNTSPHPVAPHVPLKKKARTRTCKQNIAAMPPKKRGTETPA